MNKEPRLKIRTGTIDGIPVEIHMRVHPGCMAATYVVYDGSGNRLAADSLDGTEEDALAAAINAAKKELGIQ